MTGMGKDGLEGLRLVKQNKGFVIAQNEETCVVYGMPRAVVEAGLADLILPLEQIPLVLNQLQDVHRQKEKAAV
jgi:two-component system chemotaxis response regulator CheB